MSSRVKSYKMAKYWTMKRKNENNTARWKISYLKLLTKTILEEKVISELKK